MIRVLSIAMFALLAGCSYSGVGNVSISPVNDVEGGEQPDPVLTGRFDSILTRKDGDTFTFTAYQRVTSRKGFSQHYRNYKKDSPFVNAELTVRVRRDGTVIGQPRLLLRQGENILTDGMLEGSVTLTPQDNLLTISGSGLRWRFDDAGSPSNQDVTFELQVYNVLEPARPQDLVAPAVTT